MVFFLNLGYAKSSIGFAKISGDFSEAPWLATKPHRVYYDRPAECSEYYCGWVEEGEEN